MDSKPDRVNMKFESFDHKFQICFTDKSNFEGMCKLIHKYYYFRQGIIYGNIYQRRVTAKFKKQMFEAKTVLLNKIMINNSTVDSNRETIE